MKVALQTSLKCYIKWGNKHRCSSSLLNKVIVKIKTVVNKFMWKIITYISKYNDNEKELEQKCQTI